MFEKEAEEYIKVNNLEWELECHRTSPIGEVKQAYIIGATENSIQWHDLRKDPNDLPSADCRNWVLAVYYNGALWCRARREKFTNGTFWVNSFNYPIHNVVLWAEIEIPQF